MELLDVHVRGQRGGLPGVHVTQARVVSAEVAGQEGAEVPLLQSCARRRRFQRKCAASMVSARRRQAAALLSSCRWPICGGMRVVTGEHHPDHTAAVEANVRRTVRDVLESRRRPGPHGGGRNETRGRGVRPCHRPGPVPRLAQPGHSRSKRYVPNSDSCPGERAEGVDLPLRPGGRADRRRGRPSQGDGLRVGGRPAGCGRLVYRFHPDGDLRAARHLARAQRQLDHDHRDPRRHAAGTGGAGRRSGAPRDGYGDADLAGRRRAGRGAAIETRLRRQLHIDAGAYRLQGRHRVGDRARPGAQAAGHSHHQARLLLRCRQRRQPHARNLDDHADGRPRDLRGADRDGTAVAALAGPAGRGGGRHRRGLVPRAGEDGRLDRRPDPAGLPVADPA